jgi:hypothetical protein
MWGERDDFHFVWKRLSGNFILSTRARFTGAGVEEHRKIGWTIRPSLDPASPHVTAALHGNGLTSLQYRRQTGGMTEEDKSADSLPNADAVIQLERRDGEYFMSLAQFGDTMVTQRLTGVALPDTVYVGLFVCAHNDTVTERATFSNVRITLPAPRALVPYRDYLGSNLEILDVGSGNATIVHQYSGSFQAPNWTRDGKALIYAQEGRLYRFNLASRSPAAINTGFATRNNNDHVLSFDGRMLAISHRAVEDRRVARPAKPATAYAAPHRRGGPSGTAGPRTAGARVVGERNDSFDIYKISLRVAGDPVSPPRRASTTVPSTRPTAHTSTSTPRAAGGCRSGGCAPMGAARSRSRTTASITGSRTFHPTASGSCTSPFRRMLRRTITRSTSTCCCD